MHFLAAASTASTTAQTSNIWETILPIILIFLVLYFLLIRPQQRRQKSRAALLNTLKVGDKVVTIGGIHGLIMEINDESNTVVLRVNDTLKITFERSAVNAITTADGTAKK